MAGALRGREAPGLKLDSVGVKVLSTEDGAGWLTLWSPNAGVRWHIYSDDKVVAQNSYFETGPATSASIWVGGMGATAFVESVQLILAATRAVNQVTGQVLEGLDADVKRPTAVARFFPSRAYADTEDPEGRVIHQSSPFIGTHTMTVDADIGPRDTIFPGFPQAERCQFSWKSTDTVIPRVYRGEPTLGVLLWTGPPSERGSFDVSPLHHVELENRHQAAVNASWIWRDLNSVRQV